MSKIDEKGMDGKLPQPLTDEQIVTEKVVPRRSFLASTGVVLIGGAAAVVLGRTVIAQPQDPDKPRKDPDKPKPEDPDKARPKDPDQARPEDPDKPRPQDPDRQRAQDPDKARPQDRDKARPEDPDKPKPKDPDKRPDAAKYRLLSGDCRRRSHDARGGVRG